MTAEEASSTLIEFPSLRSQGAVAREEPASVPDWRLELNEKVRAIKARRRMEARVEAATAPRKPVAPPPPPPVEPAPVEPTNPIVAAALNRVRRATEIAARASLATPAPPASAPATRERPRDVVAPRLDPAPPARSASTAPAAPVGRPSAAAAEAAKFDPAELLEGSDEDVKLIDEPAVALPEEARSPAAETVAAAPLLARALAGVIDAAVLCVIAIPFVATVELIDGDFSKPAVQILLFSTLILLAAFYLFVMLTLGGCTVGMAYSRTRVVCAATGGHPDPARVLARVIGYFLAALPLGLGFLWAVFNRERCGWHDLLSGTRVVEG